MGKYKYVIFAGVNGAGKSTLYTLNDAFHLMNRVNTDEIAKTIGDWKDVNVQIQAGKIAVKEINRFLSGKMSFNQETTLCGKSIFKNIEKAKSLGYFIELHYVGVKSVDIAKDRVKNRVRDGGHGVAEKDIERRYIESMENVKKAIPLCNNVIIYDNSEKFKDQVRLKNNTIVSKDEQCELWIEHLLESLQLEYIQIPTKEQSKKKELER